MRENSSDSVSLLRLQTLPSAMDLTPVAPRRPSQLGPGGTSAPLSEIPPARGPAPGVPGTRQVVPQEKMGHRPAHTVQTMERCAHSLASLCFPSSRPTALTPLKLPEKLPSLVLSACRVAVGRDRRPGPRAPSTLNPSSDSAQCEGQTLGKSPSPSLVQALVSRLVHMSSHLWSLLFLPSPPGTV